jgi:hypothetical protein
VNLTTITDIDSYNRWRDAAHTLVRDYATTDVLPEESLLTYRAVIEMTGEPDDLRSYWKFPDPKGQFKNRLFWRASTVTEWIDGETLLEIFKSRWQAETDLAQQATDNTERLAALKIRMRPIAANLRNAVLKLEGCVGRYQRLGLEIDGLRDLVSRLTQERDALRQEMEQQGAK